MDIMTGLSAASAAIGIAKDLNEIDRSVDESAYKLKHAELVSSLADAKLALSEAKQEISSLKENLSKIQNGDFCPKCRKGHMNLERTQPYFMQGLDVYGVEQWHMLCDNQQCGFEQKRLHDPHGAIPKAAR